MTKVAENTNRVFLFLQGPHGPFFDSLAKQLRKSGATTWRVGFNAGDSFFWRDKPSYIPFREPAEKWPDVFSSILKHRDITDLVLYGDMRPIHSRAIELARDLGVKIHVFEEGYLRPYWVTYERNGSNGHSGLMNLSIQHMHELLERQHVNPPVPPGHWGDTRQHVFYGALYHWFVLFWNRNYPNFCPHRSLNVAQEFNLYVRRLIRMPFHAIGRMAATFRIRTGSFPYHLALLQLEHDSSFQSHGAFSSQREFVSFVLEGFAQGAPQHHHLVFKAHPLEDGRAPLRTDIRQLAKQHGISSRVHFVRGGKLAKLLNEASSAVTVNSTAGQQALWRGIPLRTFGASVYAKPELVSDQPLAAFFSDPQRPDAAAYRHFRDFLLATSQLPGSYYARKGRRQALRRVADMMLNGSDPYELIASQTEAVQQQLSAV